MVIHNTVKKFNILFLQIVLKFVVCIFHNTWLDEYNVLGSQEVNNCCPISPWFLDHYFPITDWHLFVVVVSHLNNFLPNVHFPYPGFPQRTWNYLLGRQAVKIGKFQNTHNTFQTLSYRNYISRKRILNNQHSNNIHDSFEVITRVDR